MDAVVIAGGRGTRFQPLGEKALARVGEATLLDVAAAALEEALIPFLVATSPHSPATRRYCRISGYPTVETPGLGYVEDVRFLLRQNGPFLSLVCDLPFLRSNHLEEMLHDHHGGSRAGLLPLELVPPGFIHHHVKRIGPSRHIYVGINVVDKGEQQGYHIFKDPLLGATVNTPGELALAKRLVERRK